MKHTSSIYSTARPLKRGRRSGLLLVGMIAAALTSCSSDDWLADDVENSQSEAILQDAGGKSVRHISEQGQTYYVNINTPGHWEIEADNSILQLTQTEGEGPQQVAVCAFGNFGEGRSSGLTIKTSAPSEKGAQRHESKHYVVQQATSSKLEKVAQCLSSNKGAGYSYIPSTNYSRGVNLEIFNMSALESIQQSYNTSLIRDDLYPSTTQESFTTNSREALENLLAISANLSIDYNKILLKVSGHYSDTSSKKDSYSYGMVRLKSTIFSREVDYLNAVALAEANEGLRDKIYAPGFRKYLDKYVKDVNNTLNSLMNETKKQARLDSLSNSFLCIVGPGLIRKSMMGCTLDYEMAIESSALTDGLTLGGSLEVGIAFSIGSASLGGGGNYERYESAIKNHSNSKISIRGGDVNKISILTSGGRLSLQQLKEWQTQVEPETCVLIDMNLVPIYTIIYDREARQVLREYFNRLLDED